MIRRDAMDSEYGSNSMHILAFLESKANHDQMSGGDMADIEFSHKIQPFRFQVFYPIYLLFPGIPNAPLIVSLYHNTRFLSVVHESLPMLFGSPSEPFRAMIFPNFIMHPFYSFSDPRPCPRGAAFPPITQ